MSKAYYNENDPKAAAWLRELIKQGAIAHGEVDERSIEDISPSDLRGFNQCHFFAGVGGWSYALRIAGWPDDRPAWTGSCPCQPFSAAGKGAGFADERHLWPAWFHLISTLKPYVIFGEQVATEAGLEWFDLISRDLAMELYASGIVDIPAASVGAPHIRQRLYWVAALDDPAGSRLQGVHGQKRPREQTDHPVAVRPAMGTASGDHWKAEPALARVVDGFPGRVGLLRGYGNAIVPQVAAEFVMAYSQSSGDSQ